MEKQPLLTQLEQRAISIIVIPLTVYATVPVYFVLTRFIKLSVKSAEHLGVFNTVFLIIAIGTLVLGTAVSWQQLQQVKQIAAPLEATAKAMTACIVAAAFGEAVAIYGLVVFFVTGNPSRANPFFLLSLLFFPFVWNLMGQGRALIDDWRKRVRRESGQYQ